MIYYLKSIRNFFSLKIFSNTLGFKNLSFFLFYLVAKIIFIFQKKKIKKEYSKKFDENGYILLDNIDVTDISIKISQLFFNQNNYIEPLRGYKFLRTAVAQNLNQEIEYIILKIQDQIENIFKSNFKIYFTNIQRSFPVQNNIEKEAQLFHFDDNPFGTKKIFIYLTDQYHDSGAFRTFNRKISDSLKKKGFLSYTTEIRENCQNLALSLSKDNLKIQSGKKGTVMCFDNNLIHKATLPKNGFRDLIVMEVFPAFKEINSKNISKSLSMSLEEPDYPRSPFFK